jgi:hypothetical protein
MPPEQSIASLGLEFEVFTTIYVIPVVPEWSGSLLEQLADASVCALAENIDYANP